MSAHPEPLVTEAMIGAGALKVPAFGPLLTLEERRKIAEDVYLAMRKCAPIDGQPTEETLRAHLHSELRF